MQLDLFDDPDSLATSEMETTQPIGFASHILAGFECGHLGWNGHDLLVTTRHLPEDRMAAHYATVRRHGMHAARDGLPWRHDPAARIGVAGDAGLGVIWDLTHYDPPPDPAGHARRCAGAADARQPFWICPVNEPMLYPRLAGMSWHAAADMAVLMANVAKDHHPDVRVLTTDPITGVGERQFAATDKLVQADLVDVVGINYYPHTARTALRKVLLKTWRRYGKPILLSETSWHDGHPVHHRRYPGFDKRSWFRHVEQEISVAQSLGAKVVGLCWYPVVDCPPWQQPDAPERWSHGLIRSDATVDPILSAALTS